MQEDLGQCNPKTQHWKPVARTKGISKEDLYREKKRDAKHVRGDYAETRRQTYDSNSLTPEKGEPASMHVVNPRTARPRRKAGKIMVQTIGARDNIVLFSDAGRGRQEGFRRKGRGKMSSVSPGVGDTILVSRREEKNFA